jgi:hypothetical protein
MVSAGLPIALAPVINLLNLLYNRLTARIPSIYNVYNNKLGGTI